jgi:hypothetical protein
MTSCGVDGTVLRDFKCHRGISATDFQGCQLPVNYHDGRFQISESTCQYLSEYPNS